LRTLSKAHGLAGARIGALLAHADIVALLRKIILPYTLSTDSVASAIAALQPAALAQTRDRVQQIIAARNRLALDLKASSAVLQVWPSDANFLLARCQPGTRLYERWIDAGLLVRDFRHAPALSNCLRVTVGDDAQNDRLRAVLGSTS
jgi:histidinol-phosphate aminotransferase